MKATVETLKENRELVISILVENFGTETLKSKMSSLLSIVEEAEMFKTHSTIEECIDMLISLSTEPRRKTSKTAEMISEMAERRGEVWSSKEQRFIKL